jgi:hypothetical protein
MITFQAWEDIGMAVINIAAVRKLELYSADANPTTNADSLLANFIPVDEDALGAPNNKVSVRSSDQPATVRVCPCRPSCFGRRYVVC